MVNTTVYHNIDDQNGGEQPLIVAYLGQRLLMTERGRRRLTLWTMSALLYVIWHVAVTYRTKALFLRFADFFASEGF